MNKNNFNLNDINDIEKKTQEILETHKYINTLPFKDKKFLKIWDGLSKYVLIDGQIEKSFGIILQLVNESIFCKDIYINDEFHKCIPFDKKLKFVKYLLSKNFTYDKTRANETFSAFKENHDIRCKIAHTYLHNIEAHKDIITKLNYNADRIFKTLSGYNSALFIIFVRKYVHLGEQNETKKEK